MSDEAKTRNAIEAFMQTAAGGEIRKLSSRLPILALICGGKYARLRLFIAARLRGEPSGIPLTRFWRQIKCDEMKYSLGRPSASGPTFPRSASPLSSNTLYQPKINMRKL